MRHLTKEGFFSSLGFFHLLTLRITPSINSLLGKEQRQEMLLNNHPKSCYIRALGQVFVVSWFMKAHLLRLIVNKKSCDLATWLIQPISDAPTERMRGV